MNDPRGFGRSVRRGLLLAAIAAAYFTAERATAQSCSISAVTGVSFGNYDALNVSPLDQTGSITYQCGILYLGTVTIDLSPGGSGTYSSRKMKAGANLLGYNLYRDAARSLVWGNGTGGTSRYGPVLPLLGIPNTLTIYGRIPARQTSRIGSYTDTVVATLNF